MFFLQKQRGLPNGKPLSTDVIVQTEELSAILSGYLLYFF